LGFSYGGSAWFERKPKTTRTPDKRNGNVECLFFFSGFLLSFLSITKLITARSRRIMTCIYETTWCKGFTTEQHVMPLGLGCDQAILPKGTVCDSCNQYLGKHVESDFMRSIPISFSLTYAGITNRKRKSRIIEDDHGNTLISLGKKMLYRTPKGESILHNKQEITFDLAYKAETLTAHGKATSKFIHKLFIEMIALTALESKQNPIQAVRKIDPDGIVRRYIRFPAKNAFRPFAYRRQLRADREFWSHPFRVGQQKVAGVQLFFAEILLAGYWIPLSGHPDDIRKVLATERAKEFSVAV
jgi:hypothetical protein